MVSYTDVAGELCAIAALNSPAAAGVVSKVVTMPAPADSPNSVTRFGVAAESGDVVAHPLQGVQDHVAQPEIGVESPSSGC